MGLEWAQNYEQQISVVQIRPSAKPGKVRVFVDLRIGSLVIRGFR
jgi:hypothetical protein